LRGEQVAVDGSTRISPVRSGGPAETGADGSGRAFLKEHGIPALIGFLAVVVVTAIMMTYSEYFGRDHLIFFYLLPIAGIAMIFSSTPAVVTSIIAVIGAAYFLFPPVFSLRVDDRLQVVELFLFSVLAFIASKAASRLLR
jgi:two-component system sensor histidine kinase KdpD